MDNGSTDAMDGSMEGDGAMDGEGADGDPMDGGQMAQDGAMDPTDPESADRVAIDRFSTDAGTLFVRENDDSLPGPDEPINFDRGPFITRGLGPDGENVQYYNFDVQPTGPAPIYAFFHENGDPVEGQLNVVGVVPGDPGYNDFWLVNKVTVPDDYEANTITSVGELTESDHDVEVTETVKNCPIVPEGSTASKHYGDEHGEAPIVQGWYDGKVVDYFLFEEDNFETSNGAVPVSPIYVSFNQNPPDGGPSSGFVTEADSDQTHNVVATLPGDEGYSPLWSVTAYDNADFESVTDLASAQDAEILARGTATVNCPIVSVSQAMDGAMEDGAMEEDSAMDGDGTMNDAGAMDGNESTEGDGAMEG